MGALLCLTLLGRHAFNLKEEEEEKISLSLLLNSLHSMACHCCGKVESERESLRNSMQLSHRIDPAAAAALVSLLLARLRLNEPFT